MSALVLALLAFASSTMDVAVAASSTAGVGGERASHGPRHVDGRAPSGPDWIFYNARIASREGRPADVLKLWLLRNALAHRGERSVHDGDFRSVVWAALGELGVCQDGFPEDEDAAGLWPIAAHNWLVKRMGKPPPTGGAPSWDLFAIERQQRPISLRDVLSAEEIGSASFAPGFCAMPWFLAARLGTAEMPDLEDRLSVGRLLRRLLVLSKKTLSREHVEHIALVEARIFDLDLVLADLEARQARRRASEVAGFARSLGVPDSVAKAIRDELAKPPKASPQTAFLRRALTWSPDAWMTLQKDRRLALFARARAAAPDVPTTPLVLGVLDALVAQGAGDEVALWIGFLEAESAPALREAVFRGARGERLLHLEPEQGFSERPVIALHRGVAFLQSGQRHDAMRSFAWTLGHADESREAEKTRALARRWLSYVLSFYETSDELLSTLRALVPRREYNAIVEDLLWRAALRADASSFERITATIRRGSALDLRIEALASLAHGDVGAMATKLLARGAEEPYAVMRFTAQLLDHLGRESADVRAANTPTLRLLIDVTERLAEGANVSQRRRGAMLTDRASAILDGLGRLEPTEGSRARASAPSRNAFAGSVRLAPADPLPWPFAAPETKPPSAFVPISLQAVEWREDGRLVFGWRLAE